MLRTLLAGFLIPFGAYSLLRSITMLWRFRHALRWPHVWGEIVSAEIEAQHELACFRPTVVYRYEVAGRPYLNTHVAPGGPEVYEAQEAAQGRVEEYYPGRRKLVFYDPANPGVSLLEPFEREKLWTQAILGIASVSAGLYLLS